MPQHGNYLKIAYLCAILYKDKPRPSHKSLYLYKKRKQLKKQQNKNGKKTTHGFHLRTGRL